MRTTRWDLDRVQIIEVERGTRSRQEASLTSLQGGESVSTPTGSWKKVWEEEVLSLSIGLSTPQKYQHFREESVRDIYIYKEACSFVHWSLYIMFNYVSAYICTSSVSSTEKDIDTRLTKAWTATDRLSIMRKSDLTDKMKRSFFQAAIVSILLYGCTIGR